MNNDNNSILSYNYHLYDFEDLITEKCSFKYI